MSVTTKEMSSKDLKLPSGWTIRESKSKPGYFFYSNLKLGKSVWSLREVFAIESSSSAAQGDTTNQLSTPDRSDAESTVGSSRIQKLSAKHPAKRYQTRSKQTPSSVESSTEPSPKESGVGDRSRRATSSSLDPYTVKASAEKSMYSSW